MTSEAITTATGEAPAAALPHPLSCAPGVETCDDTSSFGTGDFILTFAAILVVAVAVVVAVALVVRRRRGPRRR